MKEASLTLHFKSIHDMIAYVEEHNMNPVRVSKESYELKVSMNKSSADTDGKFGITHEVCAECGKEFTPKHHDSKFCSKKCGNRSYMREYYKKRIRVNGKYVLREKEKPTEPVIESFPDDEPEEDHKPSGKHHKQAIRQTETFYNGQTTMP